MAYTIKIEPEAKLDIQEGIDWYNRKETGLGRTFHVAVKAHLKRLTTNPNHMIRLHSYLIRCNGKLELGNEVNHRLRRKDLSVIYTSV